MTVSSVEWKYFDAVAKGKVVADREALWWDARHDCVMVAKLNNWNAENVVQLRHQARRLRGLRQQSRPYLK